MSNFSKMRKRRVNIEDLQKKINDAQKGSKTVASDENEWYPERKPDGTGFAVIRFLPNYTDEKFDDLFFRNIQTHGFDYKNKWFIENCPTTIGKPCPVCEMNAEIWNRNGPGDRELISFKRKRKARFISNILVVKDGQNPENEGKVFIFRFGKKILEKISLAANPPFEDQDPVAVASADEGANFKLKIRIYEKQVNYDLSEFEPVSTLAGTDEEMEKIIDQNHDIDKFVSEDEFKSYRDLQKRLDFVCGSHSLTKSDKFEDEAESDSFDIEESVDEVSESFVEDEGDSNNLDTDDLDEALSYFDDVEDDAKIPLA